MKTYDIVREGAVVGSLTLCEPNRLPTDYERKEWRRRSQNRDYHCRFSVAIVECDREWIPEDSLDYPIRCHVKRIVEDSLTLEAADAISVDRNYQLLETGFNGEWNMVLAPGRCN